MMTDHNKTIAEYSNNNNNSDNNNNKTKNNKNDINTTDLLCGKHATGWPLARQDPSPRQSPEGRLRAKKLLHVEVHAV